MVRSAALAARLEPWPVHRKCGAAAQCDAGGAHAEPVPGRREAPIRVLCAPYAPACRVRKGAGTAPCARVPPSTRRQGAILGRYSFGSNRNILESDQWEVMADFFGGGPCVISCC